MDDADEDDRPLKPFRVRVSSMDASYSGKIMAKDKDDAINRLRRTYRASRDNRAGWSMSAQPWKDEETNDG